MRRGIIRKKVSVEEATNTLTTTEKAFLDDISHRSREDKDDLSWEALEQLPVLQEKQRNATDAAQKIVDAQDEQFRKLRIKVKRSKPDSDEEGDQAEGGEGASDGAPKDEEDQENGSEEPKKKKQKVRPDSYDALGVSRKQKLAWAKAQAKRLDLSRLKDIDINKVSGRAHEYNTELLEAKLKEIKQDLPWQETMHLETAPGVIQKLDEELSVNRELGFFEAALKAANEGLAKCAELRVMHQRPDDFYAEMIKSDKQMHRIRFQLLVDKRRLELKEERRKQREFKKFGKVIMQQKEKEKAREEAKTHESVAKWRQLREKNQEGDAFEVAFEKEEKQNQKQSGNKRAKGGEGEEENENIFGKDKKKKLPNKRRQAKNARYSTYKKVNKRNTSESTNSFLAADAIGDMRSKHRQNARIRKPKGVHKPTRHKKRR